MCIYIYISYAYAQYTWFWLILHNYIIVDTYMYTHVQVHSSSSSFFIHMFDHVWLRKTHVTKPGKKSSHLIKELQIFGVWFQRCAHRGVIEDLTQFLGAFGIQIPEVRIQSLGVRKLHMVDDSYTCIYIYMWIYIYYMWGFSSNGWFSGTLISGNLCDVRVLGWYSEIETHLEQ